MRLSLKYLAVAALPLSMVAGVACGGGDAESSGTGGGSTTGTGTAGNGSGGSTGTGTAAAPTYYEDVAPILMANCASCHRAGGIAPFELLTYEQAKTAAGAIRSATEQRIMPPFVLDNSGACNTYQDARWLDDAEIATIGAWVDGGTLEGDPANAPPVPPPPAGLDRVDVTFDMGVEYTPNTAISDDYRCFIIDPGLTQTQFMIGSEVKPGDDRVVHHVILYALDDAQAEQDAANQDAADPGPGYTCFGGPGVSSRWIVGWAPGGGAMNYPQGTGVRLNGGRKAVMQVHYNLANGAFPDRTTIDLKLAPSVTNEATIQNIAAFNLNLPPGQPLVEQSGEITIPAQIPQVRVWGVAPHMHVLGKTMNVSVIRNGQSSCLSQVNRWDFHWQGFSLFTDPLTVQGGDTVRITCGFDTTSRNTTTTWGEGTEDEMCIAFFYMSL